MSKDLELRIEIIYGDVGIERIISRDTTIRINRASGKTDTLMLTELQVTSLYKALTAYAKADGVEL